MGGPLCDRPFLQGRLPASKTVFQTLQDFVRWKAAGRLLPYKPPVPSKLNIQIYVPLRPVSISPDAMAGIDGPEGC
jgi:hypothetical protein